LLDRFHGVEQHTRTSGRLGVRCNSGRGCRQVARDEDPPRSGRCPCPRPRIYPCPCPNAPAGRAFRPATTGLRLPVATHAVVTSLQAASSVDKFVAAGPARRAARQRRRRWSRTINKSLGSSSLACASSYLASS